MGAGAIQLLFAAATAYLGAAATARPAPDSSGGLGCGDSLTAPVESNQSINSETIRELHKLWVSATADSISQDLEAATQLADSAPPEVRAEAARYVAALWRLERWLHDR